MPWTLTDLAAIEAVIAKGELMVQYSDRRVEYRSVSDLLTARDLIRQALAQAGDVPKKYLASSSKGL